MADDDPFRAPTDAEIAAAEQKLGFAFSPDYKAFLKRAEDTSDAGFEAAVILPGSGHLDIHDIAKEAWEQMELPRDLLPIVEDNGDYYCLTREGGVVFWSHNGGTAQETWETFEDWYEEVLIEEGEDDEDDEDGDSDFGDDDDFDDEDDED